MHLLYNFANIQFSCMYHAYTNIKQNLSVYILETRGSLVPQACNKAWTGALKHIFTSGSGPFGMLSKYGIFIKSQVSALSVRQVKGFLALSS